MDRIFVREEKKLHTYSYSEKIRIGLIGLGEGVGNTFVATALAFNLLNKGKTVSFVEITSPAQRHSLLFDEVAMDKRFANRQFYDFYGGVRAGDFIKPQSNMELGINWCLATPQACRQDVCLSEEEMLRLVTGIPGEVCIYDIDFRLFPGSGLRSAGEFCSEKVKPTRGKACDPVKLLTQMDVVIGVLEPMPAKMLGATDTHVALEKTAAKGVPLFYVVNKNNRGVVKKEVFNYLKAREIIWMPLVAAELFFHDQYNCTFHWKNKEIYRQIVESMDNIAKKIENITKHSH